MNFPTSLYRLAALAAVLVWSGCHGTPYQRDMMSDALSAGEQPVAMRGDGAFLAGKLTAVATGTLLTRQTCCMAWVTLSCEEVSMRTMDHSSG